MQSFDTKYLNTLESSDRKFESFDTKDSELTQSDNDFVESFDRKFKSTDEEALPDSESFGTEDSNVSIPNFGNSANLYNYRQTSNQTTPLSGCVCLGNQGSEKSKTDEICKPRSQKQIEAYKRNFSTRNPIELRIDELDSRIRHLQSLVLSLLRR